MEFIGEVRTQFDELGSLASGSWERRSDARPARGKLGRAGRIRVHCAGRHDKRICVEASDGWSDRRDIQGGHMLLELLIVAVSINRPKSPGLKTLAQGKEMVGSPVSMEAAGNGVRESFNAMILEGGQLEGIALTAQDSTLYPPVAVTTGYYQSHQ